MASPCRDSPPLHSGMRTAHARRLLRPAAAGRPLGRRTAGRHHPRIRVHPAHGLPRPRERRRASARPPTTSSHSSSPTAAGATIPAAPSISASRSRRTSPSSSPATTADAPHMRRAREVIRALGGAAGCNSFTKFYLALLGQFPYANCPSVPPEMMLLPRWVYFNLYAMSSWTRTIVVPLSIFSAHKPVRQSAAGAGHRASCSSSRPRRRCWPRPPTQPLAHAGPTSSSASIWLIKMVERWRLGADPPARPCAQAGAWMREHFADSDGLGAIFPPMIYTVIACAASASPDDSPEMRWALQATRRSDDRGRRHAALAAVLLAGVGHGPDAERPGRRRHAPRARPPSTQARRLAARPRSPPARRLEPDQPAAWSRAAGSSSTATASTPTPTTPRWC